MAFKNAGVITTVYMETMSLNGSTYTGALSSDFRYNTSMGPLQTRLSWNAPITPYAQPEICDNWLEHITGKVGSSANGGTNYQK